MTEVELDLRLDSETITTFDPEKIGNEKNTNGKDDSDRNNLHESEPQPQIALDYSSKCVLSHLVDGDDDNNNNEEAGGDKNTENKKQTDLLLDDLLFDCEIADCALLPRTFWMPSKGMEPRCRLEKCALEVFYHHVKEGHVFDPETSGAEWWVQIRPSPPAGRYNLLANLQNNEKDNDSGTKADNTKRKLNEDKKGNDNDTDVDVDLEKSGICFHWDKDEDLRLLMGGNMYIHPHISTVTYLTSIGAPTMAVNYRINALTGDFMCPQATQQQPVQAYVSWPKQGKHLSFDGRFLHAAPSDLMEEGAFKEQISLPDAVRNASEQQIKLLQRRHRRVTFLVNIWLNYKPFNVNAFPETMIDKLSIVDSNDTATLFTNGEEAKHQQCHTKQHCNNGSSSDSRTSSCKNYQWKMGSESNERISMIIPIELIRNEMSCGGNVELSFPDRGTSLLKDCVPDGPSSKAQDEGNQSPLDSASPETKRPKEA